jgi:hypothetical protein
MKTYFVYRDDGVYMGEICVFQIGGENGTFMAKGMGPLSPKSAYGPSEETAISNFRTAYLNKPWRAIMTKLDQPANDPINNPRHYTAHPSGIECIQITEHMSFCLGNAIKYIFRADHKGNALEDLKKARWYIDREIQRREKKP